jgi:hypothetical protein
MNELFKSPPSPTTLEDDVQTSDQSNEDGDLRGAEMPDAD